jgi:hypothetical protein
LKGRSPSAYSSSRLIPTDAREGDPEVEVDEGAASYISVYRRRVLGFLALVVLYVTVAHVLPRPATVTPAGWRITAIFLATIAGLMLQPLPGAALVLLGSMMFVFVGGMPMGDALSGFATPSVWLVLAAMITARALRDSGLARRIALLFVRRFGGSSLGVAYALVLTDVTLASGVPSITARGASIILPITRSIAELYDSRPGPTSSRLGEFLMTAIYQGSAVACAMFLTRKGEQRAGGRPRREVRAGAHQLDQLAAGRPRAWPRVNRDRALWRLSPSDTDHPANSRCRSLCARSAGGDGSDEPAGADRARRHVRRRPALDVVAMDGPRRHGCRFAGLSVLLISDALRWEDALANGTRGTSSSGMAGC